ncbi:MAG: caspase family protein [Chitinophagaceae bacterium]
MRMQLITVFILIIVCSISSFSQTPSLVLPVGHTDAVISTSFSPDGNYAVTVSLDGTAKLWEANTGMLIKDFRISGDASIIKADAARFSKDGKLLVIIYEGDHFSVYRMTDGKPFEPETEGGTLSHLIDLPQRTDIAHILQMFSSDSRFFIYGWGVDDPFVFNVQTGKKVFSIKGIAKENYCTHIFFSPDNRKLFVVTDKNFLFVCNASTGAVLKKIKLVSDFNDFIVADNNRSVVCIADIFQDTKQVQVLNLLTGKFHNQQGVEPYGLQMFNEDGNKMIQFFGGEQKGEDLILPNGLLDARIYYDSVSVWDVRTGKRKFELSSMNVLLAGRTSTLFGRKTNKLFLPEGENKITVFNGSTGTQLYQVKADGGYLRKTALSSDEKWIMTLTGSNKIIFWNVENGSMIKQIDAEIDSILDFSLSEDKNKLLLASANGSTKVWDIQTQKEITSLKGFSNPYLSARLSADGRKIFLYNNHFTKTVDLISGDIAIDSASFIKVDTNEISFDIEWINGKDTISRTEFLNMLTRSLRFKQSPDWNLKICNYGVNLLFLCPAENEHIEANSDTAFSKIPRTNFSSFEIINDAQFSDDSKKLIVTYQNNYISVFDISTGKTLFSYIDMGDNDYLIVDTITGYYKGTTAAARKIHYVADNKKVITFEQLDVKYNRPDKILESIGSVDTALIRSLRNAYEKRIKKLGIDTTSFQNGYDLPTGEIANRNQISFEQKSDNLTLKIIATDQKQLLQSLNILMNEVPLWGFKGIDLTGFKRKKLDTTITVKLTAGENIIEVSVFNQNGIENYRVPLKVNYNPALPIEPKVYFAGIGTNMFADSSYNLRWCVQDIRDLAAALASKFGKQFILVDTLFDDKVNIESVQSIKKKLLQTGVNDKVIISFSGHGLLSSSMDYFLSAYHINFQKPELGGLPYELLENLLDSLPARKKLLLLDACHSGEVDKEDVNKINASLTTIVRDSLSSNAATKGGIVTNTTTGESKLGLQNSFDLMQNLFANVGKGTGATIIAASGGVQLAQERSDLGHGVFTFSIIEALKKFKTIKIAALKKFVSDEVFKLTRGLQKPTARMEPLLADWNLW